MRKYYYDQYSTLRSWRHTIPTLIVACMALVIYAATTVILPSTSPNPQTLEASPAVAALSTEPVTSANGTVNPNNLLGLSNQERSKTNVGALRLNDLLNTSAANKCQDMVKNDYWSHVDQAGQEPWHFIDAAGYQIAAAGENLAYGFTTPEQVIQGWMNSPEHKTALLDANYQDVGFGICTSDNYVGNGKQIIVVQHFGRLP